MNVPPCPQCLSHNSAAERIVTDLERQLAEYQRSEASLGDAYATCIVERDEAKANQHDSRVCVPISLYNESNTMGRQLVEAVIPLLDAIRGCDNEVVLEVVRPHAGIVGDILDRILEGK